MNCRGVFLIFSLLHIIFTICPVYAQPKSPAFSTKASQGLPFVRNYSPKEYKSHMQNWAIVQGPDGRMFFGNGDGVLVFDNEHWKLIPLPNYDHVRSMGFSSDSLLYIGGNNELGYIQQNSYGQDQYFSLRSRLPEKDRDFDRIRSVIEYNKRIYFQTYERLFIWDGKSFAVHHFDQKLHRIFLIQNKLFGVLEEKGLVVWEDTIFKELPHGNAFVHKSVTVMLPFDKDKLLIGIKEGELYIYSQQGVERFETEAAPYLKKTMLYKGCYINETQIALGDAGLVVIDKKGKLNSFYNEETSLQDKNILSMYSDTKGNLWLGLQVGISKIAFGSPVKIINEQLGIKGAVKHISQHLGQLFVVTTNGLFIEQSYDSLHHTFLPVDSVRGQVYSTYSHKETLLVGTDNGIKVWKNGKLQPLFEYGTRGCFTMQTSIFNPSQIWATIDDGVGLLTYLQGEWHELGTIRGLTGAVRNLVQLKPNEIWVGTRSNGIYQIRFPVINGSTLDFSKASVTHFGAAQGLPKGETYSYLINNSLYIWNTQAKQVYKWNDKNTLFERQPDFGFLFGIRGRIVQPWSSENSRGEVYLKIENRKTRIIQVAKATNQFNGFYRTEIHPVSADLSHYGDRLFAIDKEAWYGGSDGILYHQLWMKEKEQGNFPVLITALHYDRKSVAYHNSAVELPYHKSAVIRFDFAAPIYRVDGQIKYQTKLEGFDEHWSAFHIGAYKEYTNLWEGNYVLHIRALYPTGKYSAITSYSFKVTPPWYRYPWMYVLYTLLLGTWVYGFVRFRSYQLQKKNKQLENIITKRTQEVRLQAEQLKNQAEQLKELDRFKSRFFANISHEFRTPLTLISSPVQTLLFQNNDPKTKQQLTIIQRNARHLLKLVNQLLDLSRIESHKLKLKVSMGNIVDAVRIISMELESAAISKGVALNFQPNVEDLWVYYEPDKLEKIVGNIVANAIKFTDQGSVNVSVNKVNHKGKEQAEIVVADTGTGIVEEQLPYVFDRFFQADTSSIRKYEGTGIGLSLAKELVQLHGGEIMVQSKAGQGSTFYIYLPVGKEHFNPEHVIISAMYMSSAEKSDSWEEKQAEIPNIIHQATDADFTQQEKPIVLVVEDNTDLRYYLRTQLQEFYQIEEAENGKAGLEKTVAIIPDLVISDVMMPVMDGCMLCVQIKGDIRTNHIPVILLTAKSTIEDKLQGLVTGADAYLTKPFTPAELQIKIKNLINTRKSLRKKFSQEFRLRPTEIIVSSQQQHFLERLKLMIEQHMEKENFGVEELCREMAMSRTQLNRKLQAVMQQTPSELIKSFRLQRAVELIKQNAGNMAEIAYQVGFTSQSYFTRAFQETYGCTPMEYKRQMSKEHLTS